MFVAKELSNFVNVIFFGNCVQNIKKVGVFEIPVGNAAVVIYIERVEDAHNDCISIPILKLWCCLQKLESWMCVKQMFE